MQLEAYLDEIVRERAAFQKRAEAAEAEILQVRAYAKKCIAAEYPFGTLKALVVGEELLKLIDSSGSAEAPLARVEALLASWQAASCNDGCAFELDRALHPK